MIFIYGDSHARFSFKNLNLECINRQCDNITMFRIGRDNIIINFNKEEHDDDSILCFTYGEIDCRCHIQRQINNGRNEDDIIHELVNKYFETIKNNVNKYKKIIIVGIIPPTRQCDYENIHGPILHEYPFVGTNEDRVRYTKKTNETIQKLCQEYDYIYFNPYYFYTRDDGTLKYELSDSCVHLGYNSFFLEKFIETIGSFK
jgi:hypothetical protein